MTGATDDSCFMDPTSIQDRLFAQMSCFGCGPANARGLQLKSYASDGYVEATFMPWPEHDNGLGFLNGGIIATLLDCHSAAAVLHEATVRGWNPPPGAAFAYVTAGIDVRYLRPTPLDSPVQLRAAVRTATDAEITAHVQLQHDDKIRAIGDATWKRWRAR
jgi:acyl-coenzyme A thioesterase PaaI-like protein